MNNVLEIDRLSKRYRIGLREEKPETLVAAALEALARPVSNFRRLRGLTAFEAGDAADGADIVWALKDVSFQVPKGQIVGIIGRNGSGKSTLLKTLSRVTEPTSGRAVIEGRIAALLEVGTGFHPELSGRDNIYLNGTILGMRRAEIACKFDEIVDFSGVETYIDTPVKRYSSGMYVRLAFAVAAHLEPEILVVDEVLAVGDAEFQAKCLGKMRTVAGAGRTVLFVSHNMAAVRSLCDRAILLDRGVLKSDGNVDGVIATYLGSGSVAEACLSGHDLERRIEGVLDREHPSIRLRQLAIKNADDSPTQSFNADEAITIEMTFECFRRVDDLRLAVLITDESGTPLLASQQFDNAELVLSSGRTSAGVYKARCVLPANIFGEQQFFVDVQLECPKVEHLIVRHALKFDVKFSGHTKGIAVAGYRAMFRPKLPWSIDRIPSEELQHVVR